MLSLHRTSTLTPRVAVKTAACQGMPSKNKAVFETLPCRGCFSVPEVREIYDIAMGVPVGAERDAIYCVYGMDGVAVEAFLPIVEALEKAWKVTGYPRKRSPPVPPSHRPRKPPTRRPPRH